MLQFVYMGIVPTQLASSGDYGVPNRSASADSGCF